MTLLEIHIGVQQGLRSNPVFANASLEHEEIDVLLNHVIPVYFKELREVVHKDRTTTDELRVLEAEKELTMSPEVGGWYGSLPSDYDHFIKAWSYVISKDDVGKLYSNTISGKRYITECRVKVNGSWQEKGYLFVADSNTTIYGGQVREVKLTRVPNRLNENQLLTTAQNAYYRKSSPAHPIGEVTGSEYKVYGEFELYGALFRYYKLPPLLSYGEDGSSVSPFARITNENLIDRAVAYYREIKEKSR